MSVADLLAITERTGLGVATIMARRGVEADAIGASLGCTVVDGPVVSGSRELVLLGTGPGMWLAVAETVEPDWADDLAARLGAQASVSDQTGGYAVHRIAGPQARRLLQRGMAIDLHPAALAGDAVITTSVAHIGVTVWPSAEGEGFDLAVFRSFSHSLLEWLAAAARDGQAIIENRG